MRIGLPSGGSATVSAKVKPATVEALDELCRAAEWEIKRQMEGKRMLVLKLTTRDGRQFFSNKHTAAEGMKLPNVVTAEFVEMTEGEYVRIPATNESADFFAGKPRIGGRAPVV